MAENKNIDKLKRCININMKFNEKYMLHYFEPEAYVRFSDILSLMRKNKELTIYEHGVIYRAYKHYYTNYYKIRDLQNKEPRLIAQKFIGKKKIRLFIMNRDGNKCLKCFRTDKLQLDHIMPISRNGKNTLSNLQTLCNSCNSIKRDSYADYRSGSRQINYIRHGKGITLF